MIQPIESDSSLTPFERKIELWKELRKYYWGYSTPFSIKVVDELKKFQINRQSHTPLSAKILLCGSFAFGQAIPGQSDLDLVFVGDENREIDERKSVEELIARLTPPPQGLGYNFIDEAPVKQFVRENLTPSVNQEAHIPGRQEYFDFMTNYWNTLPLDASLDQLFEDGLRLPHFLTRALHVSGGLKKVGGINVAYFANSFEKYRRRLYDRGVIIPTKIQAIQKFLLEN